MTDHDDVNQYRVEGTSIRDARDTRTLYVLATSEEQALELALTSSDAVGYENFKPEKMDRKDFNGSPRVIGMTLSIQTKSGS